MKKSLILFGAVAAVVIALAGCQRENSAPLSTHKVTFIADQNDTRTTVSEEDGKAVFTWTEADKDNFHVFENGYEGLAEVTINEGVATIEAVFDDHPAAEYKYTCFVSGATAQEGACPAVLEEQTTGDNLYDSSADILVAEPKTETTLPETLKFAFKRTVAVSKMTIKNIPAGETVETVTISADKSIAGYFNMDSDAWVEGGKSIDVTVNKLVPEGDSLVIGFASLPAEEATFTVKVSTYSKNFSKTFARTLSLTEGRLVAYKVNMSGCEVPLFYESFDKCDGTGGNDDSWSGSIASATLDESKCDNSGWTFYKGNAADKCAKFGTGSILGYATTPALGIKHNQNTTVSFKAGAWSGDNAQLVLELEGNGYLSAYQLDINSAEWTDCSVVIAGGDENTKLKIAAAQASKNRFFLDEVKAETGGECTYLILSPSDTTVASSSTKAEINVVSNGSWTAVSKKGNTVTPSSGSGNAQVVLSFAENTLQEEYLDTVTFTAAGNETKFYLRQQAGAMPTKTISEFIAQADTANNYQLTGIVTDIASSSYGTNFNITDATGTIYVYKFGDEVTFVEGDKLTLYGKYAYYEAQSQHEVVGGKYVSHVTTPKLSVDKSTIDVAYDETSATFNITGTANWTVNSTNVNVVPDKTSGTGAATITLSFPENESTTDAVTSTITISSEDSDVYTSPWEIAFTQSKAEPGTLKTVDIPSDTKFTYSGSGTTGILTLDYGALTIVQAKGNSSSNVNSAYNTISTLRVYAKNTLTFTSDYYIKKIEFTSTQGEVSVNTGKLSTSSATAQVWEGTSKQIVFTASAQWRITSIKVTYLSNEATITVTDPSINTNGSVNVSTLFSSNSTGAFTYELTTNPGDAGTLSSDGVFSATKAGTYKVTATQAAAGDYGETKAVSTITVTEPVWTLQSIAITTAPTKTEYEEGDKFNPEGMVVTGTFADENSVQKSWAVDGYTYPTDALTQGTTSVTISYTYNEVQKSAEQAITVTGATTVWNLKSIAVTTAPTKTSYSVGETLDLSGMVVKATYSDAASVKEDKQETVTGWTSDPANGSTLSTAGDVTVTISYTEDGETKTTTQTVTVAAASKDYTCTFTSKAWATGTGEIQWTSGKDGTQLTKGQGVQVTTGVTGANATTNASYTNVSKVVVTYCTNASKGVGVINIQVGTGTVQKFNVTKPSSGGTTLKTTEFTFSPNETGNVKISVDCTSNSVFIYGVTITAQ